MGKYIETALPLANQRCGHSGEGRQAGAPRKPSYVVGAQPGSILSRCFGCCCNGFFIKDC